MYGTIPDSHRALLRQYVAGKRVLDLGAGDGERAEALVALGADHVVAVDPGQRSTHGPSVTWMRGYFGDVLHGHGCAVGHLAWPSSHALPSLPIVLADLAVVVYIGKNTDETACGPVPLWTYLVQREVLALAEESRNTMIVYGARLPAPRPRAKQLLEEVAGLNPDRLFLYESEGMPA